MDFMADALIQAQKTRRLNPDLAVKPGVGEGWELIAES